MATNDFDFNTAPTQQDFDVIPDGTIAVVQLKIRPGNAGPDGILKRTKKCDAEGLDCQFTVVGGQHDKRKFWAFLLVSGTTDGQQQMADKTRMILRTIIESVRGIKSADVSEAAKKARHVDSYSDFDGMRFMCKIGVEPANDGYRAKNKLDRVITPDDKEWQPVEQVAKPASTNAAANGGSSSPSPGNVIVTPAWAQ